MSKCTACGNELPPNARFCGNCGHVQEATSYTDAETRRSETPPPSSWSFYNSAAPDNIGIPPTHLAISHRHKRIRSSSQLNGGSRNPRRIILNILQNRRLQRMPRLQRWQEA